MSTRVVDGRETYHPCAARNLGKQTFNNADTVVIGLGISELFLQIWNETGCFHGQICRRTRIVIIFDLR